MSPIVDPVRTGYTFRGWYTDDGRVRVTFIAPGDNGGSAIIEYRVTSTPGNLVVTTTNTTVDITGLTNGTTYTFTVEARNSLGYGAVSASSAQLALPKYQ